MILQQQEHSIGSDLEKTKLSIIHITRARLCFEYESLFTSSNIFHCNNFYGIFDPEFGLQEWFMYKPRLFLCGAIH